MTTKCTTPPEGWYCTRPAGHTGPCAAHELPSGIRLWLHPHDGRTRITQPGSVITADAGWNIVGELVLRRPEAEHNARLYGAINNLMAHIGANGSVNSDSPMVDDVMQALKAIDGGTFQPGLATPTEAAAMAATVPAGKNRVLYGDEPIDDQSYTPLAAPQASVADQPAEPSQANLLARIQELEAQLQPYLDAEAAAEELSVRRHRVEEIAAMLFPQFDSVAARRDQSKKPPQWHDKSWWWNGVSVDWGISHLKPRNGTVCINLSSYVGGGDVEDINVHMPVQWLEAEDWKSLVSDFIAKKVTERAAAKAAAEAAEAQRQIAAAQATLARLAAPKGDSNG